MWNTNHAFNLRVSDSARKRAEEAKKRFRPESSALFRRRKLLANSNNHLYKCHGFRPVTSAEVREFNEEQEEDLDRASTAKSYIDDRLTARSASGVSRVSSVSTLALPKSSRVRAKSSGFIRSKSYNGEKGESVFRDRAVSIVVSGSNAPDESVNKPVALDPDKLSPVPEGASVVVQERIIVVTPKVTVTRTSPTPTQTPEPAKAVELAELANLIKPMVPYNQQRSASSRPNSRKAGI